MEVLHLSDPRPYREEITSIIQETDNDFYPPLSERYSGVEETKFNEGTESTIQPYISDLMDQSLLLVIENQQPVGLLSYTTQLPGSIGANEGVYMSTAALLPEYRDQGIASHLVSIVLDFASEWGTPVYTRTWEHNEASQALLESMRFKVYKIVENDRRGGVDSIYYEWKPE